MLNFFKAQCNLIIFLLITVFSPIAFSMDKPSKRKFESTEEIEITPKKQCLRNNNHIFIDLSESESEEKLIQCQVCLDEISSNKFLKLSCCSNSACTPCLLDIISLSLAQKTVAEIVCPNRNCMKLLGERDVRKITDEHEKIYELFCEVASLELINKAENIKHCPTPDCSFSFINDCLMAQIRCPKCFSFYCCNCLQKHTNQFSCEEWREYLEIGADKSAEQEANEKWLKENTQACPRCKTSVQKTAGCNAMICGICKYQFCWGCLNDLGRCICAQAAQPQNNLFQNQHQHPHFHNTFQARQHHPHFQNTIQTQHHHPHFQNTIQTQHHHPHFHNAIQTHQHHPHFHNPNQTHQHHPHFQNTILTQHHHPHFQNTIQTQHHHPHFHNAIQARHHHPDFHNTIQTQQHHPDFHNTIHTQHHHPDFYNTIQAQHHHPDFHNTIQAQQHHPDFYNTIQAQQHHPNFHNAIQTQRPHQHF